jgi:hypothetical protein
MENLEEQIKDPNQLDMFAGILLTSEQEQMVTEHIERAKETVGYKVKLIERTEKLLIESGFIKDVDFINDFKVETITNELQLGSSYRGTSFITEVTYLNTTGNIGLKGTRFYNGILNESTFNIDIHDGKINCYGIQGSSRFIKPETLLGKLKHHNEKERHAFQEFQKKTDVKQYTVEKYKEKYPNATVTLETEWTKYSGTFDIMKIEFISGSWVKFRLFSNKDKESIYSKYDNKFAKLNTEEILNKFNNQEASN